MLKKKSKGGAVYLRVEIFFPKVAHFICVLKKNSKGDTVYLRVEKNFPHPLRFNLTWVTVPLCMGGVNVWGFFLIYVKGCLLS
jgi:hypothetical protein